jgi:hypothetical protein
MAPSQYYEKVAGDESGDAVDGERKSSRVVRAPPTEQKKRSVLTTVAFGAIALTVFIAVVAIVSTAVVSYRLPAATEAALSKQSATPVTPAVQPSASADKSTTGMGGFDGMNSDDSDAENHSTTNDKEITNTDNSASSLNASSVFDTEHHKEMTNCGSTPDEARAAGCVFDVMMQLWTPPECMDAPLSERFLEKGNWTWYADSNAEHSYSDEEIRKGNHDVVYVAQSYHRHHCIFAWERLVRALRNQGPLIEELVSYDHVMHCRHRTLTLPEEGAQQVRGVVAPTGYTRCASYDVWIKGLPFNKMSSIE